MASCPTTAADARSVPETSALSRARSASEIATPNGDTWMYPSEEQFSRALARKGKGVPPEAVPDMLSIHNALNDAVWARVAAAERLLRPARYRATEPALAHFEGRPGAWSPTALWHMAVRGGLPPFDRHDWLVAPAGVRSVRPRRYVIDYYASSEDDGHGVFSVHIRPAIDSPAGLYDRLRLWYLRRFRGVDPFA